MNDIELDEELLTSEESLRCANRYCQSIAMFKIVASYQDVERTVVSCDSNDCKNICGVIARHEVFGQIMADQKRGKESQ